MENEKGKGKITMPQEMVNLGCGAATNSGQPICYSYSLVSCKNPGMWGSPCGERLPETEPDFILTISRQRSELPKEGDRCC